MTTEFGQKWKYDDAVYKKKRVGVFTVELIGGTQRGAVIRVWAKANQEDIERAEKLPHIFTVSQGFDHVNDANFMYFENAKPRYTQLNTTKDVIELLREAS